MVDEPNDSDSGSDLYAPGGDNNIVSNVWTNLADWDSGEPAPALRSSFEAFFAQESSRVQTSSNVFSSRVLPLSQEEFSGAIAAYKLRSDFLLSGAQEPQTKWYAPWDENTAYRRFLRELDEGFNLLFYGLGSKRHFLNKFAVGHCASRGHVVVVNGWQANISLKDIIASIEKVPAIRQISPLSTNVEIQTQRIYDYFCPSRPRGSRSHPHLYLIIHNIDSPSLRSAKFKSFFSLLALNPHIHLIASIDRLNAPLIWSASEISARKHDQPPSEANDDGKLDDDRELWSYRRGYAWLWHDVTTLLSYDHELAFANRSSISGASALSIGGRGASGGPGQNLVAGPMTETAAQHILASVTIRAKKLFLLLGRKQLENIAATQEQDSATTANQDLQQFGLTYNALFISARELFITPNDSAMSALLGEFRDHGLILSASSRDNAESGESSALGGANVEALWIPLRKERLDKLLQGLSLEVQL